MLRGREEETDRLILIKRWAWRECALLVAAAVLCRGTDSSRPNKLQREERGRETETGER